MTVRPQPLPQAAQRPARPQTPPAAPARWTSARVTSVIKTVVIIVLAMIICGLLATVAREATRLTDARTVTSPPQSAVQQLVAARASSGLSCHLEWDGAKIGYEVICAPPAACARVAAADQGACATLYARPATTRTQADGTVTSDPAGPALVAECTSQYHGTELHYCLTQPAE